MLSQEPKPKNKTSEDCEVEKYLVKSDFTSLNHSIKVPRFTLCSHQVVCF